MPTRSATAALVAMCIGALLAAPAEQGRDPLSPQPTFRADANYVRVDMYAMRDGRPVEDLAPHEIELLEDDVAQTIADFEHVSVRSGTPAAPGSQPAAVGESRQAAQDPRARVFVIFLDTYHVQVGGSRRMRRPLVQFLDSVIGADDLVAVMTPEMSAADLAFGRKTTLLSDMMQENWAWGRRDTLSADDKETLYEACYPPHAPGTKGIAYEMIDRRREKLSLDALEDLVIHLRGLREERKAVLTISEGWRLFDVNRRLDGGVRRDGSRQDPSGREPIFVGPDGKLRRGADPGATTTGVAPVSKVECEADRRALAELDNGFRFRRLFDHANRANVSFYPVYPRGLAPFDSPIGPRQPQPLVEPQGADARRPRFDTPATDQKSLAARQDALRELAANTDGIAVIGTNAIESAMQRIVSDLTSYYLLGYYSSNTKLDGRFREITVRVKRPGVVVRARRGYRGLTAEDLTSARETAANPAPVTKAFDTIAAVSSRSGFRLRTAAWTTQGAADRPAAAIWIVGEVDYRTRKDIAWSAGATAELVIVSATGAEVEARQVDIPAGEGAFAIRVPEAGGVGPGEYAVRVRVRPAAGSGLPVSDTARVVVPEGSSRIGEAVLWRRGPTTGPKYAMTADPRFQRSERIRLEHATTAAGVAAARMLDRAGNPMAVPVQVAEREDESGEFRWLTAEASLAPLAPGDYAIELTLDEAAIVTAFKVVP